MYGWHSLAFYPDSDHLTFCTAAGMVETWDTRTARRVSTLGHGSGGVAASSDYRWLLAATGTAGECLTSFQANSRAFALPQEESAIWSFAWSRDNQFVALGLADGGLTIWNVPKIQAQLSQLGLEWHPDARAPRRQDSQPYRPTTPLEKQHQVTHYLGLANRLAWVARLSKAEAAYRAALALKPDDVIAHGNLGMCLEDQGHYADAESELNEAIKLRPERGWFWVLRGWIYADMGQWEKARADFVRAMECKELNEEAWYSRAMLHLRDGDLDGYREVCSDMIRRFGTGATWTCTLSPNCGTDPARVVEMAEKLRTEQPKNHWRVNQLGAALYRAGRFEDAVKVLTEATELSVGAHRTNMLHTWLYLAMAHHRLGHASLALGWLQKAKQGTEKALKPPSGSAARSGIADGTIPPNWHKKLTLQLLLREAEQLMQGPGTASVE
jgi:tetratricopeptide (TPR) repeat protein